MQTKTTKTMLRTCTLLGGAMLFVSMLGATPSSAQTAVSTAAPTAAATMAATTAATAASVQTVQTIQDARAAKDGAAVMVQGTVTVATNLFDDSGNSLYIQDATGGVNVYFGKGGLPSFAEGDTLQVSGKMLTFANHREIAPTSLDTIKKLNSDAPKPLTPMTIHSADGMAHAGQLSRIQGVILAGAADYFVLTDSADVNQGNVNVYIYDTTGIGFSTVAAQQKVCVTGIVDPYNAAVEILPRHPDDIQMGGCPQ